jgi:hypothetical protein
MMEIKYVMSTSSLEGVLMCLNSCRLKRWEKARKITYSSRSRHLGPNNILRRVLNGIESKHGWFKGDFGVENV